MALFHTAIGKVPHYNTLPVTAGKSLTGESPFSTIGAVSCGRIPGTLVTVDSFMGQRIPSLRLLNRSD